MEIVRDGFLAFVSAVGLATLVWLLAGPLLRLGRPWIPGLLLVLPVRDEAPAMEQDLRELLLLQREVRGAEIILVDCGLTRDAQETAVYLALREDHVRVIEREKFRVE